MEKLVELKQERSALGVELTALKTKLDAGTTWTEAERSRFAEIDQRLDAMAPEIEQLEKLEKRAKEAAEEAQRKAQALVPIPGAPQDNAAERRELEKFSFARFVGSVGRDGSFVGEGSFEKEMLQEGSREASSRGINAKGLALPSRLLGAAPKNTAARAQTAGTANQGGYAVATEVADIVESLAPMMVLKELGAQMIGNLTANQSWPKAGAVTSSWATETGTISDTSSTFGQATLSPKRLGTVVHAAKQWLTQVATGEAAIRLEILKSIAQAVEAAAIEGGGSNEPSGIIDTISASVVGGTNGLAPTWAHITSFPEKIGSANAMRGSLAYLTNYKVMAKLQATEKASGNGWIWNDNAPQAPLNGFKCGLTSLVPSDLTKGTSSGVCSAIIFGNFNDLFLGEFGVLDLIVDPYKLAEQGLVRLIANTFWDVEILNAASFATMEDALTA